jgi:nucleotide-binding universal stress UspA family protein
MQIHQILVPFDFSPTAREALAPAADLARRYGAALVLLHVYEPPLYPVPPDAMRLPSPEVMAAEVTALETDLEGVQRQLQSEGVGNVTVNIAQGDPVKEILREIKDVGIDLVVIGTHGRTGLKHLLLGSVAEKVVRSAPCPVLTVRGPAP